jgi:hypothetical protein
LHSLYPVGRHLRRGFDPETVVERFIKFSRSTGFQALGH